MNIIMKMKFGSKLYGTATANSDTDYKGIYIPKLEDFLLQKVQKCYSTTTGTSNHKNTKDDIDEQIFSFPYFLELCKRGDTYAIDMLHAPDNWEDITSDIWQDLKSKRHLFYTKNLESFLSYCKHQAAKYGQRGGRINAVQQVVDYCKTIIDGTKKHRIVEYINNFPYQKDLVEKYENYKTLENGEICLDLQTSYIFICGKKFIFHDYIENIVPSLEMFLEQYGERARLAAEDQGIDYKAIHHAFRAGLQLKEIYETGNLVYPLKDREFLLQVKQGHLKYKADSLDKQLDDLIDEISKLSVNSLFPDKCDGEYWDNYLLNLLKTNLI